MNTTFDFLCFGFIVISLFYLKQDVAELKKDIEKLRKELTENN